MALTRHLIARLVCDWSCRGSESEKKGTLITSVAARRDQEDEGLRSIVQWIGDVEGCLGYPLKSCASEPPWCMALFSGAGTYGVACSVLCHPFWIGCNMAGVNWVVHKIQAAKSR